MPDLTNHVLFAMIAKRPLRVRDLDSTYYLGALLPDLMTRPFHILVPEASRYLDGIHTPVSLVAACLGLSLLFRAEVRASVQKNLLLGGFTHLLLDLFQRQVVGGYPIFYPFSDYRTTWGLWWPDQCYLLLPILGAIVLLVSLKEKPEA